jgi:hypothetical protein
MKDSKKPGDICGATPQAHGYLPVSSDYDADQPLRAFLFGCPSEFRFIACVLLRKLRYATGVGVHDCRN